MTRVSSTFYLVNRGKMRIFPGPVILRLTILATITEVQEPERRGNIKKKRFSIDYLHVAGGNDQPRLPGGRFRMCTLVNPVRMVGTVPGLIKTSFRLL